MKNGLFETTSHSFKAIGERSHTPLWKDYRKIQFRKLTVQSSFFLYIIVRAVNATMGKNYLLSPRLVLESCPDFQFNVLICLIKKMEWKLLYLHKQKQNFEST